MSKKIGFEHYLEGKTLLEIEYKSVFPEGTLLTFGITPSRKYRYISNIFQRISFAWKILRRQKVPIETQLSLLKRLTSSDFCKRIIHL